MRIASYFTCHWSLQYSQEPVECAFVDILAENWRNFKKLTKWTAEFSGHLDDTIKAVLETLCFSSVVAVEKIYLLNYCLNWSPWPQQTSTRWNSFSLLKQEILTSIRVSNKRVKFKF